MGRRRRGRTAREVSMTPSWIDPLIVRNPKIPCSVCHGRDNRRARRRCAACEGTGCEATNLANLWFPSPAFLVCGGPSLKDVPRSVLQEPGVLSLGINNSGAYMRCSAWTYGDTTFKFHFGAHLDAKCVTFAPYGRAVHAVRAKLPDGTFRQTTLRPIDCPGCFTFGRSSRFKAETFLTTTWAHWGSGGKDSGAPFRRLATMLLGFRLLHYLGCPAIYLIGADFDNSTAGYAWQDARSGGNGQFAKQNIYLRQLRPIFDAAGFRVYNATPGSKCDAFPFVTFDEALRACRWAVPREPYDMADWYGHTRQKADLEKWPTPLTPEQLGQILNGVGGGAARQE